MRTREDGAKALRNGIRAGAMILAVMAGALQAQVALAQPVQTGQPLGETVGVPWVGERGITESVQEIVARDSLIPGFVREVKPFFFDHHSNFMMQDPASAAVPKWPFDGNWNVVSGSGFPSRVMQHVNGFDEGMLLPQTISNDFIAATIAQSGFIPPDTMGDVGPTQIMTPLNGRIRVFTKAGVLTAVNTTTDSFFNSVRNGSTTSDPRVVYDKLSQRWFVVMINTSSPNRIMIAVSSGPVITSTASFTFYQFQQDSTGGGTADNGALADYPSLGVDANALYIGCNMFNPSYTGTTGWVVRKSSVLSGGPIVVTTFRQMSPVSGEGPYSPRGVSNDDPAATEGYFLGTSNIALGRLVLRRISDPGGTPSISSNILLTVPTTANPINVPAQGSTTAVDALNTRLYDARIYRNRSTGSRTLWTAHTIQVNSSGVASSSGGRNGARWYQIGNLTATPTLVQSGTLFDSAASSPRYYTFPTVAMSGQGHMGLGASFGGAVNFMSAAAAGRLSSDPLGTIQAPTTIVAGAGSYNVIGSGRNRWGDYSSTVVDPEDDQSMWTFTEYASAVDTWAIRVTKLLAPPPATPSLITPGSVEQGQANVSLSVTGTSVAGSAFYDTEPGFNRLQTAFSGAGITVNSIAFNSETSLTLNVSVSGGAATGLRNLTVTNPDGQSATGIGLLEIKVKCVGDLNNDGLVDDSDFVIFAAAYDILDCSDLAMPPGCPADLNGDGFVDDADFVIFAAAYDALLCP
ncbi:MAG: hypothetical protein KF691_10385 [Phycisphaeraceae bacterium]|nr:hypothetical protein [Phycisphaeraceae bacterium]